MVTYMSVPTFISVCLFFLASKAPPIVFSAGQYTLGIKLSKSFRETAYPKFERTLTHFKRKLIDATNDKTASIS